IEVSSEVGRGSTFSFTIPTTGPAASPSDSAVRSPIELDRAPPAAAAGAREPQGQLLLIVEDDPAAARLVSDYLKHAGYKIAVAANAKDALELAERLSPAVILLDIMLGTDSGWDILAI